MLYYLLGQVEAIQVDLSLLNFVVGFVIPLLVGLITKLRASSGLKASMNLALSVVGGAIVTVIEADGTIEDWKQFLTGIVMTWLISQTSYTGLWKPNGVSAKVQEATANTGLGSPNLEVAVAPSTAAVLTKEEKPAVETPQPRTARRKKK